MDNYDALRLQDDILFNLERIAELADDANENANEVIKELKALEPGIIELCRYIANCANPRPFSGFYSRGNRLINRISVSDGISTDDVTFSLLINRLLDSIIWPLHPLFDNILTEEAMAAPQAPTSTEEAKPKGRPAVVYEDQILKPYKESKLRAELENLITEAKAPRDIYNVIAAGQALRVYGVKMCFAAVQRQFGILPYVKSNPPKDTDEGEVERIVKRLLHLKITKSEYN